MRKLKDKGGRRKAEGGRNALSPLPPSPFRHPPFSPRGLTLIELLVTIVIMVTVLAGVIPLMSPNNDGRKIREASRQLASMCMQAQAQAARDGRPVGIAFRESDQSGIALEAFFIAVPRPFAGYSASSQLRFRLGEGVNEGKVQEVQFVQAGQFVAPPATDPENCYAADDIPPLAIRYGDVVHAGGALFVLTDPDRDGDGQPDNDPEGTNPFKPGDFYVHDSPRSRFQCRYITDLPRDLENLIPLPPPTSMGPLVMAAVLPPASGAEAPNVPPNSGWTSPRAYSIERQPTNTAEAPLQLPRGIGIDLQGSGIGPDGPILGPPLPVPTDQSFDTAGTSDIVGIMFSPNGQMASFYFNGVQYDRVSRVYLLVGKIESGNATTGPRYDFRDLLDADDAQVDVRRREVNWTDPDSRWVTINARSGRVITSENRRIDLRNTTLDVDGDGDFLNVDPDDQIQAARDYAADMIGSSGR